MDLSPTALGACGGVPERRTPLVASTVVVRYGLIACQSTFDNFPLDLAGHAQALPKLVDGGVNVSKALDTSGLVASDNAV